MEAVVGSSPQRPPTVVVQRAANGQLRDDIVPDELASYSMHALAAAASFRPRPPSGGSSPSPSRAWGHRAELGDARDTVLPRDDHNRDDDLESQEHLLQCARLAELADRQQPTASREEEPGRAGS